MKVKTWILSPIFIFFLTSCHSGKDETNSKFIELNKRPAQEKTETSRIDPSDIIATLQGEWKEEEYPFRRAHFKNSTVKFTEEGVIEEPKYQEFKILNSCPFEVNNIKNTRAGDIFLVMVNERTCEIIKISNNKLTLSGFSVNTNRDYHIHYNKINKD